LVGLNVFSKSEDGSFLDALGKDVNISSNSWGIPSCYIVEDDRYDDIFENGSKKGTIFVFAAGNDRYYYDEYGNKYYCGNANNTSYLNNKYTIVVAAMDANGTYSSYSNFGDDVLVAAPAGEFGNEYHAIVTTDLTGLDYGFDSVGHLFILLCLGIGLFANKKFNRRHWLWSILAFLFSPLLTL
jgi:hypothetical protein